MHTLMMHIKKIYIINNLFSNRLFRFFDSNTESFVSYLFRCLKSTGFAIENQRGDYLVPSKILTYTQSILYQQQHKKKPRLFDDSAK